MKKSAIASAAMFVAAAALVFGLVTPASATVRNAKVIAPSSITLNPNVGSPQTFPLGVPPATTPPVACGLPAVWTPTVLPINFLPNDTAPTSMSANFNFQPGAAEPFGVGTGWKRVEIAPVAVTGAVNSTTGAITNITGTAKVTFKNCSAGLPVECVLNATIGGPSPIVPGTGTITPVPPIATGTLVKFKVSGKLATTTGCGFTYVIGLNGATFDLDAILEIV